jgi:4-amino-4-deoxy-L-arabinose transferase-like glycosyltransferase
VLGPAPRWFVAAWAVAGLGVITKGVGFLPLLALVPFAALARRGWPTTASDIGSLSLVGAAAMLVTIGVWFVPMMLVTSAGGELLAYRNEILFEQTVTRYAEAWHHHKPFWYYLVQVIPLLWLPVIALVPWLWPRWRVALRERNTLVALLLAWVVIVIIFFSASPGKRSVYLLPAVPALAMAAAPWLPDLLLARGSRRVAFGLAAALAAIAAVSAGYLALDETAAAEVAGRLGSRPVLPLAMAALAGAVSLVLLRVRDGWLAYAAVLTTILVTFGLVAAPRSNAVRSGQELVARVEEASASFSELGLVGWREQFLLHLRRPSVNFGHARWREAEAEAADAAAWLAERAGRALLVERRMRDACFSQSGAIDLGGDSRYYWFLVYGLPDRHCVERGDLTRARLYTPPDASLNTGS